jgi:Protein of unknown function (DUF3987)
MTAADRNAALAEALREKYQPGYRNGSGLDWPCPICNNDPACTVHVPDPGISTGAYCSKCHATATTLLEALGTDQTNGGDPRKNVEKSGDKGSGGTFSPHNSTYSRSSLRFPPPLSEAAYCGLAGEIVHEIEPHSEADPAAVLLSLLAMFGNAIGRGPYFQAGDAQHATNLYVCIVGDTSSGRKGTSAEGPRRLLVAADESWKRCVKSGLVSGEGVIHHVRDECRTRRSPRKGEVGDPVDGLVDELVDPGVEDKRLMVIVPEFAQVLGAISRRDNTLSAVIRDLWDRGDAQTLAKNSPEKTTGALVSILVHVTPVELRSRLDSTEIGNGFANRFLFVASERSKLLPRGGNIPPALIDRLSGDLARAIGHSHMLTEVDMAPEAWDIWDGIYGGLTTAPPGLVGAIIGRGAPMVRRIALLYALMGERDRVFPEHLLAAVEVWRYVEESARWVFGDRLGEGLADRCLGVLREAAPNGLTRTELREQELGNRITSERINDALQLLAGAGLARCVAEATAGRPREWWFATEEATR